MHSRVRSSPGILFDERNSLWGARDLLQAAREARLDRMEGFRLPDLALLAHLQHHGAATPLLDVTVDPLVALWMVAHASTQDPTELDDEDGYLFGIRRPDADRWLDPLDARPYWDDDRGDVAQQLQRGVHWYRPPDISERLRIQRGSFLVGPLVDDEACTLPLTWRAKEPWLERRVKSLGKPQRPPKARTDVVVFRIRSALKQELRQWMSDRAGLTREVIYPTPWHRPYVEDFCRSYGRSRPLPVPE